MPFVLDVWMWIALGFAALLAAWGTNKEVRRRTPYRPHRPRRSLAHHGAELRLVAPVNGAATSRVPDAADQLRTVERVDYGLQPVLRHQEGQVFIAAETAVREAGLDWRVFAQVSLGEVLTCRDTDGFNAINAKRVDLLIADAKFRPLAAIEYHGSGHHLSPAAARDAVKKEALRKAGIAYIGMTGDDGPADVRREIARLAFARAQAGRRRAR